MLREIRSESSQRLNRRWFQGADFDLLVWHDAAGPSAWLLSEKAGAPMRALRWQRDQGLSWHYIDGGDSRYGHYKASDLLTGAPAADPSDWWQRLLPELDDVEPPVRELLAVTLR